MLILRTLTDRSRGLFKDFDPTHFCDVASDGSPFYSSHSLRSGELWIGQIFKDFPDEDWQIRLIGEQQIRGAWKEIDRALRQLWQWYCITSEETNQWRKSIGLLPLAQPSGTLELDRNTGICTWKSIEFAPRMRDIVAVDTQIPIPAL